MLRSKEKYLLVVSFLEGKNFSKRSKVKFVVEVKFDGEHLATDPVDYDDTIEINQELAWELDRKSLQAHRLQRTAIKANCFAVGEGFKENVGYIVLDLRSAPEGNGKSKWYQLLQPKYPKLKPLLHINLYIEGEQSSNPNGSTSSIPNQLRPPSACSDSSQNLKPSITLVEDQGYYLIGKSNNYSHTYELTFGIAFARNLLRLVANTEQNSDRTFYFVYNFLKNQVTTKPFQDIVSSQINSETSTIKLHSTVDNLKEFFKHEDELEISFCSNERLIANCFFSWKKLLEQWNKTELFNEHNPIVVDCLLKFESTAPLLSRSSSPVADANLSPVIGVQIALVKTDYEVSVITSMPELNLPKETELDEVPEKDHIKMKSKSPVPSVNEAASSTYVSQAQIVVPSIAVSSASKSDYDAQSNKQKLSGSANYVSEEIQLRTVYELQKWKEAREQEFEQELKKLEAKKFQAYAEAFKQRDIERELIVQKKIKEYTELEAVLRNSLNEVEKREKQLALNEAQVSRLKADLHRDYENKLIELREASKRVQEKADHQTNLVKSKCETLEEEISRLKRMIHEWERKYSDKEAEFSRYREKESSRPEIRLQSELNILNLEKIELERKLDSAAKARNHYKEQWTKAMQEISALKKREEANAKAFLKKQQSELEHLRMRYLAAEENELIKSDEKQLHSLKQELERLKLNAQRPNSEVDSKSVLSTLDTNIDPNLKAHINRLVEERDTLLRTGVYSNTDAIIVELDKRIRECLKEAKQSQICT